MAWTEGTKRGCAKAAHKRKNNEYKELFFTIMKFTPILVHSKRTIEIINNQ